MRLFAAALIAASVCSAPAAAAPTAPSLDAPQASAAKAPAENVRVAMRQQTLPAGGRMDEHRPEGERFLFVVAGRLKVSNLVTGEEQLVEAGKMAAETPGDWHVAEVVGAEPVTLYVIDRGPAAEAAVAGEQRAGN